MYQESMGAEADCTEAIYNLGVVNKRLGETPSALGLFEKLHAILPSSIEVVWQIADLFDISNQPRAAIKWFKILNARVPTDPGVLARIGNIYLKEEDEAQAFHYHQESYRYFPVNMNVISWLGAYPNPNPNPNPNLVKSNPHPDPAITLTLTLTPSRTLTLTPSRARP